MTTPISGPLSGLAPTPPTPRDPSDAAAMAARRAALREVSVAFEAVFLAQMLDYAGVGRPPETFGGGAGEEAFRGHLVQEQATLMAERGGIGLADTIYRQMAAREGLEE